MITNPKNTDGRTLYKVRRVVQSSDKGGYAITLPFDIAERNKDTLFSITEKTDAFLDYRNKVIDQINQTFQTLREGANEKRDNELKQQQVILRSSILSINSPVQNSIVLASGAQIARS